MEEEDWRSGSIIKCIDVTFSSDSRFSSVSSILTNRPLDEEIVFIFQTSSEAWGYVQNEVEESRKMIDPRIVSRLTHVDSFTHTYICIYTSTHTCRYDPRYSYFRFSFVFIPKEIVSNERIVAVLEIRRFMIRKIRAFCYYVPSRTLHCLVCTIS